MKTIVLFLIFFLLMGMNNESPRKLKAEDFLLEWNHLGGEVHFKLSAPTNGWLAIGFSKDNSISKTNLIQGCIKNGEVHIEDQYVIGMGVHPPVEKLGGKSRIRGIGGYWDGQRSTISFSIPEQKMDAYHLDLSAGNEIYVWLAYSISVDFDHHSRKRILRQIQL